MMNESQLQYSGENSASTSLSSQQDVEDDRMIALVLTEEYAKLYGAVSQRLSKLEPVPHVPRINSFIPTINDASADHWRLLDRLNVYGLCEVKVSGDGNCQFRALSDQLYRSPEHHKHIRKGIVKQLKDHRSLYECYVPMKYKRYYKKMAKSGEWGDHVTLQAASDKFAAKICLLTSFRDTCFIEIVPLSQAPQCGGIVIGVSGDSHVPVYCEAPINLVYHRTCLKVRPITTEKFSELWLSFWSEIHYNSLYAIQDAPIQHKPRRKHWLF